MCKVVHFRKEARKFYDIESLWGDAPAKAHNKLFMSNKEEEKRQLDRLKEQFSSNKPPRMTQTEAKSSPEEIQFLLDLQRAVLTVYWPVYDGQSSG